MKIEFKKVPQTQKEFKTEFNSVKLEGKFCRISTSLVKIESTLSGKIEIECCRCNTTEDLKIDESFNFLLSDGIYNKDSDEIIIEVQNGTIDFDEIIQSEIDSIMSDYNLCKNCSNTNEVFEKEY